MMGHMNEWVWSYSTKQIINNLGKYVHEMHCFSSRQKQNLSSQRFIITYAHTYVGKEDCFEKNILIHLWDTSYLVAESCKGKQKS